MAASKMRWMVKRKVEQLYGNIEKCQLISLGLSNDFAEQKPHISEAFEGLTASLEPFRLLVKDIMERI